MQTLWGVNSSTISYKWESWGAESLSSLPKGTQLVWSEDSNPDLSPPTVLINTLLVVPKLLHSGTLWGSLKTPDAWFPLPAVWMWLEWVESWAPGFFKSSQMTGTYNRFGAEGHSTIHLAFGHSSAWKKTHVSRLDEQVKEWCFLPFQLCWLTFACLCLC